MERAARERLDDLFVRLRDGDRGALRPAFDVLWPVALAFARRALGGSADAEDAAQIALEKVFSRAHDFDPDRGDALAWTLGVTAFECKTILKRTSRRREDSGDAGPIADAAPDPETSMLNAQLVACAQEVLSTMRPADVEAIEAAIGARQRPDVPQPTFRKRLERALARLRHAFGSKHELF